MMKRKIYVASSWRNEYYPEVVAKLREAGHDVYDFRNPPSGDPGFKWSSVSEDYMEWSPGGVLNSIATCCSIPRQNGSSTTTSRRWKLAILVYWCCLVGVVHIPRLDGLLGEGN